MTDFGEDRTLSLGCHDIVVVGRLQNNAFVPVHSDGQILGQGWVIARITVRRVVKGSGLPAVVAVHYLAHTYLREDRDFMLVLHKSQEGAFDIAAAQLMSLRPRLAAKCQ